MPLLVAEIAVKAYGGGVLRAAEGRGIEARRRWPRWDDVDHPTQRAGAVKIGSAARGDGDGLDSFARNFVPVDPTAEGVVHGNVVLKDERAASGRGPESAQRNALAGWVLNARTGAAEEFEACLLAELIVQRNGRVGVQVAGGEGVCGIRGGGQIERGTGRGDGDLLAHSGGMKFEVEVVRVGLRRHLQWVRLHGVRGCLDRKLACVRWIIRHEAAVSI